MGGQPVFDHSGGVVVVVVVVVAAVVVCALTRCCSLCVVKMSRKRTAVGNEVSDDIIVRRAIIRC